LWTRIVRQARPEKKLARGVPIVGSVAASGIPRAFRRWIDSRKQTEPTGSTLLLIIRAEIPAFCPDLVAA
jgi:hypothetical protein